MIPQPKYFNLEYIFDHLFVYLRLLMEKLLIIAVWLSKLAWFSIFISMIALVGIFFLLYKILRLNRKRIIHLVDFLAREEALKARSDKWEQIQKKANSDNSSDWKMSIIEADSLIDQIITKIGYPGEDLGEKLKNIEPSDFDSLQDVWDAHKIRNKIAHEGDAFQLTQEIAKETIEKYKKALKELKYI